MASIPESPHKVAFSADIHAQLYLFQKTEEKVFDVEESDLWVINGDLINKGPESLEVLRRARKLVLAKKAITILGNHELGFLASEREKNTERRQYWRDYNKQLSNSGDIFKGIDPEEKENLLHFLASSCLLYRDDVRIAVHAGLVANSIARTTHILDRYWHCMQANAFYNIPRSIADFSLAREEATAVDGDVLIVTGHHHEKDSKVPVLTANGKRARIARGTGKLNLLVHEREKTPVVHLIEH